MASDPTTCRSCGGTLPADHRGVCPTCGDLLSGAGVIGGAPSGSAGLLRRPANRRVGLIVLAIMLGMAAFGLVVSLKTMPSRQARNPRELLGYVPSDASAVVVIHAARSVQEVAGRQVLTHLRLGAVHVSLPRLERWTRIPAQDVKTIVLGLRPSRASWPPFVAVLQTNTARTTGDLTRLLPEARQVAREGRALIVFGVRPEEAGVAWQAAEQVVVLARTTDDLTGVPEAPAADIGHLAPALQDFIRGRLGPEADVWMAATSPAWDQASVVPLVRGILGAGEQSFRSVTTLGAWARFGDDVDGELAVQALDEAAARRLATGLEARPDKDGVRIRVDGSWVVVRARGRADSLLRALGPEGAVPAGR